MSKIYEKYLILKQRDDKKLYLFKNGNFYIFLKDDCDYINEYVVLKKTLFTKDVYKCGFPIQSLEQYMHVFHNHKLNVEVIDDYQSIHLDSDHEDEVIASIRNLDINNLTPLAAINFLADLKEKVNEKC